MVLLSAAAPPAEVAVSAADVEFSNSEDPQCTVITLSGRRDTALLMQVTGVFTSNDVAVSSANINSGSEGSVCDVFRVTDAAGGKVGSAGAVVESLATLGRWLAAAVGCPCWLPWCWMLLL